MNLVVVARNLDDESVWRIDVSGYRNDVPLNIECVRHSRDVVPVRIDDVPLTIEYVPLHKGASLGWRAPLSVTLDVVP